MNVKRLVVWVMTQALLVTQTGALAQTPPTVPSSRRACRGFC